MLATEIAGFSKKKTAYGKNHFSQPWRGRFTCLNSRLTYKDRNISSGIFGYEFRAWEGNQKCPTRRCYVFVHTWARKEGTCPDFS